MSYNFDKFGRWVPDADIDWKKTGSEMQAQLEGIGLNWGDDGEDAFNTSIWRELSADQRLQILQQYDTWYDTNVDTRDFNLNDEAWGLDLERGLTYNGTWDALSIFQEMTGGVAIQITVGPDMYKKSDVMTFTSGEVFDTITHTEDGKGEGDVGIAGDKRSHEWRHLTNPYKYSDKVRGKLVSEQRTADGELISTTYQVRQFPMDWNQYTEDALYRATIDELIEKDYSMFMGPGADFDNATQVRAANQEMQSWIEEHYKKAEEAGESDAWAEAEYKKYEALQIAQGHAHNARYPEGRNTRGYLHNQQVQIRKWRPSTRFDPETGTKTSSNPLTGEIRDTYKHVRATYPTRMTTTHDIYDQDVNEGRFLSTSYLIDTDGDGKLDTSNAEHQHTESITTIDEEKFPIKTPNINVVSTQLKVPDNLLISKTFNNPATSKEETFTWKISQAQTIKAEFDEAMKENSTSDSGDTG